MYIVIKPIFLHKTTIKSIHTQIIMTLDQKKNIFVKLGDFLRQFSLEKNTRNNDVQNNDLFYDDFIKLIELSQSHNGWFTPENVYFSIESWGKTLTEENLSNWLNT